MARGQTNSLVELVDLYPTLAELAGLPVPQSVQGRRLVPVLNNPGEEVREDALTLANGFALRTDHFAFLRYRDGSEELYDMSKDPHQFTNLATDPAHDGIREQLRKRLEARTAAFTDGEKEK